MQDLLTKRDLVRRFQVSEVTVANWQRHGMPHRTAPGDKIGEGWGFDLAEVVDWRRSQKQRHVALGGVPLEDLPPEAWGRPHHLNAFRYFAEQGTNAFLWHWFHHCEGFDLLAVLLRDAHGGDKRKAADDLLMMVVGLFGAYADWVSSDAFNEAMRRDGHDLDALWRQFSKDAVSIKPPSDPEQIQMQIPDWLLMKSAEFARTYWTDQPTPNSERRR